ncbi:hypothetical protein AWC38_SpisGene23457 [Stylophora pistillata]|uniref:Reverse transcriptase domain-containing protein n=1 Tax=Stylophora pistillata TaxID=50429 RepID=A0A2B4R6X7_STYPI|nr:hypothetical protein AWC38_SpisGene23457 [Stylophora pistillata]
MIFSLRQLQEKCKEQQQPLYIAFIDLTKAFDLVSRDAFSRSEASDINGGVKQGCVLAPTLFNILFSLLLNHAFKSSEESILIRSRSDGKLFNPARLRAKTKVRKVVIHDLLFADDVALVAHSAEKLQLLLNQFSDACEAFRLTSSLKKTKVMSQDNAATPAVTIKDYILEAVTQFTYLGSTTSNNNCLEVEIGKRIGKAATNMAKLSARVWENKKLTTQTKVAVYRAWIVSTLLFVLLNHAFKSSEEGILIRSRSDGKLFNPARLRAKTKVRKVAIRDLLFADDVALVAHSAEKLQLLLNQFSDACEAFRLTSSLKKTKVMSQDNAATPAVTIKDYILEAVTQLTYLGCTTSNNNCLEVEIGKRIGKAATNMAKLSARV